jgi:hypothetical protein
MPGSTGSTGSGRGTAETVEIDGAHETVAALALVQYGGRGLSQFLVVDPIECEEGSFYPNPSA